MKRKKTGLMPVMAFFLCLSAAAQAPVSWTKEPFTIQLSGRELAVARNGQIMAQIAAITFNGLEPLSVSAVRQTRDTFFLQITYAGGVQSPGGSAPLTADIAVAVRDNTVHFTGNPSWASRTTVRLKDNGEQFFGLVPLGGRGSRKSPGLRGLVVPVAPAEPAYSFPGNTATALPPFFMTNQGYASFFDTWTRGRYRFAAGDTTELQHQTGTLDWYFITGPNGDAVLKEYYAIVGRPGAVPLWACGPIVRQAESAPADEVPLEDAKKMSGLRIPFTAWITDSVLRSASKEDRFSFACSACIRRQPLVPAFWGAQVPASWDGMAASLANAVRFGFMGFPLWGTGVGGFPEGPISETLYARWLQWGAWNGLFEMKIDDAGGERAPWRYSETLQDIFRRYCAERMKLVPTIFSAANTAYRNGVLMKPLAYVYPTDTATYPVWDEYLFTDAFLVAPLLNDAGSRTVYLPAGEWFDYYHPQQRYGGGQTITVQKPLEELPVFVRANAVWVEGVLEKGSSGNWDKSKAGRLQFYYFPGSSGTADANFDYVDVKDGNKEKPIHAHMRDGEILVLVPPITGTASFNIRLNAKPLSVLLNSKKSGVWNAATGMFSVSLRPGHTNEIKVTMNTASE